MPAVPNSLLDLLGLAEFLNVSESTADRLRRDGLPALDVTPRGNGRRPKHRTWRFDQIEVLAWLRERRGEV